MKYTNYLTHVAWEEIPYPSPGTWDLSDYIPEGLLLHEHLFIRYRQAVGYWTNWTNVPYDAANRQAIWSAPFPVVGVEIRRQTPRYDLVRDPLAETGRVSETELQVNADQGMMVALEWAAEYGVNGHSQRVSGLPPISIGGKQHTQNHWGPTSDFGRKVWNFQFSGGYLHKTHVKAQARVSGEWVQLPIDYTYPDSTTATGAQFRMVGPFQLYLDLGTLSGPVDGLVIYRRTPREDVVDSPDDAEAITGPNMTPSAKHALFVAVELGEEMSRNVPACECLQVFTSQPYFAWSTPDAVGVSLSANGQTRLVESPRPVDEFGLNVSVQVAQLRDLVITYNNALDSFDAAVSIVSANLIDLSGLVAYALDQTDLTISAVSASLTEVVVSYNNFVPDSADLTVSVVSATIT